MFTTLPFFDEALLKMLCIVIPDITGQLHSKLQMAVVCRAKMK